MNVNIYTRVGTHEWRDNHGPLTRRTPVPRNSSLIKRYRGNVAVTLTSSIPNSINRFQCGAQGVLFFYILHLFLSLVPYTFFKIHLILRFLNPCQFSNRSTNVYCLPSLTPRFDHSRARCYLLRSRDRTVHPGITSRPTVFRRDNTRHRCENSICRWSAVTHRSSVHARFTITTRNGVRVKWARCDTGPTGILARVRADAGAVARAYRWTRRSLSLSVRRPSCDDASRASPNDSHPRC